MSTVLKTRVVRNDPASHGASCKRNRETPEAAEITVFAGFINMVRYIFFHTLSSKAQGRKAGTVFANRLSLS
jgi:hypothetical protein